MRILYVEDLEAWRRGIVVHLLCGHEVEECSSLREARAAYTNGGFDVVLLDFELPDGTGADFTREIRSRGDRVAIIANSSASGRNALLLELGADYAVLKSHQEELTGILDLIARTLNGS